MAEKKSPKTINKKIWLSYFNQYLYENGMITEDEKIKMAIKIQGL